MNKAYIEIILVVTIAANLIVYNITQSHYKQANAVSIQANPTSSNSPQVIKATSRLAYHSKMIAIESVLIAKYSVKLMFDAVNKAI
ncbi:MAG: hypothetical protein JKX81_16960 [Arenicella sp.]|nr:hypothetical protein [Arenicella sp.]